MTINLDPSKIQFTTVYQVDKSPVYSTLDDGQGLSSGLRIPVGTVIGSPSVGAVTAYIGQAVNPYGKKCLTTLSWSLDGTNFYPASVPIWYYNTTYAGYYWQMLGLAGCSNDFIYLCAYTQYDIAVQNMYIQVALDSPT